MSGNGPRFRIVVSKKIAKLIEELHESAMQLDKGQRFIDALQIITNRLHSDPREFGEPLYPLRALKLLVYVQVVLPAAVDYGVHDELPVVFLQDVRLV